jgi:flagellar FliL protein
MADEKDIAEDGQGGGRKKLIIIIAAAVLLLVAAGGAALFLLGGDGAADGEHAGELPPVEEGDPVYYGLDPAFVVTLPPGGSAGMLQVAIEIMTRTESVIETLERNGPMIRHHVLNLLEQRDADTLLTVAGKEALQTELHTLLHEQLDALGERGRIQGVYFTQFVMQ